MFHWLRELLEIKYEFRERRTKLTREVVTEEKVCQSCETLREQLAIANYEKSQVLNKLLKDPEPTAPPVFQEVSKPKMIPWNVRRQMLEREDREKARALRSAAQPDVAAEKKSTEELEKELDIATAEREAQSDSGGNKQVTG
jgi:hypothetical protein